MTFTRPELMADVQGLVGNPGSLDQAHLEAHIDAALAIYSRHRPRVRQQDYTGDGVTYDFQLPADYQPGLSELVAVEYPAGSQLPSYLPASSYFLYRENPPTLRLLIVPASGRTLRVSYTASHVVHERDATQTTVPATDRPALASLAAARACLELASIAAKSTQSYQPDIPMVPGPVERYLSLARELYSSYLRLLGLPEDGSIPAWLSSGLPFVPGWTGGPARQGRRVPF